MRPGGIQDESSKHEHQEVPKLLRFLSQTKNVVKAHLTRLRPYPQKFSQSSKAVWAPSFMTLQGKQRRLNVIYTHTAWMGRVLLAAEKSQLIDAAFVKKVAALKDDLEVATAALTMPKENSYVHLTLFKRAIIQVNEARRLCAYLCKVLDVERAEL